MIRGCLMQIVTWGIILAVVLWFFRNPESVAGLIVGFADLASGAGDALGRFATALQPLMSGLI
ncbi:hypothetical protein ACIQFP_26635 [Nocardiopsis alba]|uniref:hypothetical protein n=1 Tax=Nocardiopsis alba TaxID=53437 RepID=UPI0037F6FB25